MTGPVDARGVPIVEGSWVVFTTNARESGLQFGHVHKIKDYDRTESFFNLGTNAWDRRPVTNYKIQFLKTDAFGAPQFETEYDSTVPNPYRPGQMGAHVDTDKQKKSGYVELDRVKFLVL